jgi:hypothetical protein
MVKFMPRSFMNWLKGESFQHSDHISEAGDAPAGHLIEL